MANNTYKYGFRWVGSFDGKSEPKPIPRPVASGLAYTPNGGSACDINVGDPVIQLNTGYVTIADGSEGSGGALKTYGIVMGFGRVFDGALMQPVNKLVNGGGVYGTNYERQTFVHVVPAANNIWEIDVDDNTTFTTYATYLAAIGENADHILVLGSEPKVQPRLDISTHATTNTLQWRIVGISQTQENQDYSGTGVKLYVTPNLTQQAPYNSTGV